MKKIVAKFIEGRGYRISRIETAQPPARSMDCAVELLAKKHAVSTIIDIGASSGIWSRMAMKHYPKAKYLLIEAQSVHKEALLALTSENNNVQFTLSAAGEIPGEIYFDAADPFGGQASFIPYPKNYITVPVVTVDDEVDRVNLNGPYLLKLDTHGFEVPILKGAQKTLDNTEVIVIECYNFKISPECLLFYEMCTFLEQLGFRCVDLADPLWRLYDQSFWQMDLIFLRKDNPQFNYSNFQ